MEEREENQTEKKQGLIGINWNRKWWERNEMNLARVAKINGKE